MLIILKDVGMMWTTNWGFLEATVKYALRVRICMMDFGVLERDCDNERIILNVECKKRIEDNKCAICINKITVNEVKKQ